MTTSLDALRNATETTSRAASTVQIPQLYLQPGDQPADGYQFSEVATLSEFLRPAGPNTMGQWTWCFWAKTGFRLQAMNGENTVFAGAGDNVGVYLGFVQANATDVSIQGDPLAYGWNHIALQSGWGGAIKLYVNGKFQATADASGTYAAIDLLYLSNTGFVGGAMRNIALFNSPLNEENIFTQYLLGPRHDLMRLHGSHNIQPYYYWRGTQEDGTGNFTDSGTQASTLKLVPYGTATWGLDGSDDLISARIAAGDERILVMPVAATGTSNNMKAYIKAPGRITSVFFHAVTAPTSSQAISLSLVTDALDPISDTVDVAGKTMDSPAVPDMGFYTGNVNVRFSSPGNDVVNGLGQFVVIRYIPLYVETPAI